MREWPVREEENERMQHPGNQLEEGFRWMGRSDQNWLIDERISLRMMARETW